MATTGIVAATTGATTVSEGTLLIVLACGVIGYVFAVMTRRAIGITPWHIPAFLWGLLAAMLAPFGLIIEVVARLTTRLPAGGAAPERPEGPPVAAVYHTAFPANPAGGSEPWPAAVPARPGPGGWRPAPAGAPWTSTPPLFGWYEDPSGSHEERYWDGRQWSDHVRDAGVVSSDPLAPYAAAPAETSPPASGYSAEA
jgi:hypothetical protein